MMIKIVTRRQWKELTTEVGNLKDTVRETAAEVAALRKKHVEETAALRQRLKSLDKKMKEMEKKSKGKERAPWQ